MAGEALAWNTAPVNLERYNRPSEPMEMSSFGFKGYPDMNMFGPKQPLRQQPSADVTRDVNKYFRKDSPKENQQFRRNLSPPPPPPPQHPPQPPQEEPPAQYRENSMPQQRQPSPMKEMNREAPRYSPPPPPQPVESTISPRYIDHPPISERRRPVIPELQRRNMTSAEVRKYEQAFMDSESDRLLSQRKKEEALMQKRLDQAKVREMQESYHPFGLPGGGAPLGHNQKMLFTEHQLDQPPRPAYQEPPLPKYPSDYRRMGRGRTDFDQDFRSPRPEAFGRADTMPVSKSLDTKLDVLRQQEQEISEKRRLLEKLEREHVLSRESRDERAKRYEKFNSEKESDLLRSQEREIRDKMQELRNLKAMDDFDMRRPPPENDYEFGRAQSEPQTERFLRNRERDRQMFGHTDNLKPLYFHSTSPRREPVGKFFGTNTEYKDCFDEPTHNKTPRKIERNPYKNSMVLYHPFGLSGGGAPMISTSGQRDTKIKGSMGILGREASANARRAPNMKTTQLNVLRDQIAERNRRDEAEKEFMRSPGIDYVDSVKAKKVGYAKVNEVGLQSEKQHLPHAMSKSGVGNTYAEQMQLKRDLDAQTENYKMRLELGKKEERHLEKLHMDTSSKMFCGDYGGGNKKGPNIRKLNLDQIIDNHPRSSSYYNKVLVEDENYRNDPDAYFEHFKPRITVNSTHRNLYEFPEGNIKLNYHGRAPYAEHGSY